MTWRERLLLLVVTALATVLLVAVYLQITTLTWCRGQGFDSGAWNLSGGYCPRCEHVPIAQVGGQEFEPESGRD